MKLLFKIFRNIEQKNKAQLILELLTVESSIEESVTLYKKVKADFMYRMSLEKERLKKESILIDGINKTKNYDPNFDKKLSEIETEFEIITKQN